MLHEHHFQIKINGPSKQIALSCFMFRMGNKILTKKTINQNILKTKYAVRGELAIRADKITRVIFG